MITLRTAVLADAPIIAKAESKYIDCPWTERQIADEIGSSGSVFFVAECDGEFCGYVSCNVALDECEINNIAVEQRFRRRGAGKMLLNGLICELASRGVKSVFLLVRDGNAPAIGLYNSLGFTQTGLRKNYYKEKDALIMRLNL